MGVYVWGCNLSRRASCNCATVRPRAGIGYSRKRELRIFWRPDDALAIAREQCRIERDLSSLQLVGYGGATISPGQIDEIKSTLGCDLYQFFGATETGGAITFLTPEDHQANDDRGRKKLWSCGRPSLFAEIKIIDENGKELGTDQDGEFVVRSPANIISISINPLTPLNCLRTAGFILERS